MNNAKRVPYVTTEYFILKNESRAFIVATTTVKLGISFLMLLKEEIGTVT